MEQTFHRNPWKALLLLLGSLTFVVVAVLLLSVEHDPDKRLRATAVIAFFGLCAVVGVIQLLPNSGYLRLTEQDFVVRSNPEPKGNLIPTYNGTALNPEPSKCCMIYMYAVHVNDWVTARHSCNL